MSKFFVPPDFEKKDSLEIQEKPDLPFDFQSFLGPINKLLRAIESGESKITKNAISDLKKAPVQNALTQLNEFPTLKNLVNFLNLVEQDINLRAKREIVAILNSDKKNKEFLNSIPGVNK